MDHMQEFKLANVLLEVDDFLGDHPELLYRGDEPVVYDAPSAVLECCGAIDFLTYFNALPIGKWKKYAQIDNAWLHIEIAGDACDVRTIEASLADGSSARILPKSCLSIDASAGFESFDIAMPTGDSVLAGFVVATEGSVRIRNAYYFTKIASARIKPVCLALCTTTFQKEDFIIPNIEKVKDEVLAGDEPIAGNFHMYVVDNGRTLDAEALSDAGVTVCPNDNVGGAGGFARGMIEALESERPFTHVLLMDDDVRVSPESFKRAFNLLSLATGAYAGAFINGAMLQLEHPNIQFEDVSVVRKTGGYQKIKPDLDIGRIDDVVRNEAISVEQANAYGAWWYSIIPVSAIKEHGLPLPLFVRGDDVEYGMRCLPTYMTMGGICVWHAQFTGRFRASVDAYQYARNMLIVMAVDGCSSEKTFMMRYWRVFRIYLRMMNYDAAGLWLDGLEDYLKGPEFIAHADGAAIMKENAKKNERLIPIDEIDRGIREALTIKPEWLGHDEPHRSAVSKALESLPHDRHYLPSALLSDKPAIVDYSGSLSPWHATALRKVLVALDQDASHAHVRRLDKARYRELVARYRRLKRDYDKRHARVEQDYRDSFRDLTSLRFWKEYLRLS